MTAFRLIIAAVRALTATSLATLMWRSISTGLTDTLHQVWTGSKAVVSRPVIPGVHPSDCLDSHRLQS
jgi:hypothetical protein